MADRTEQIDTFLRDTDWAQADRAPLAGDASNRRYVRLHQGSQSAVLMDATSDTRESLQSFVKIGHWLSDSNLSAPKILHADMDFGLLLLEDLGDDLFAKVVQKNPDLEAPLYTAAADVLISLHNSPPPKDIPCYDPQFMADKSAMAYHWYQRGAGHLTKDRAKAFQNEFERLLNQHCGQCNVLTLRDYHAENLIWLPDRKGIARVGLLDFQDAMTSHRAYDLMSLLQDARRDVPTQTEIAILDHYINVTGVERDAFLAAYAVLGAQRNLRILGGFARLCMHAGKAHYVDYIPRVWRYVLRNLNHPALSSIRKSVLADLPEPDPHVLKKLKNQCATIPTP
ncbi:hypothetical protein SAMN05444000_11491 [Shimia gijangensis]|uniref:Aminoglycoside phosphotransferase domain-containing protein n=1 Tax=Shimia gijangensis TaxID=1470563 RepID=A0A1M6MTP8_9RHOB|nr:phosphotransferase [Shimia gijangensis]SHJ86851.1 hypothetical protein SAMN05444000_11491 [Shimia gijangensis]